MDTNENLNFAVFTVKQIMVHHQPILYVFHDEDNDWQFLPGTSISTADAMIVGLGEILKFDPRIESLLQMEPGYSATRESKDHSWIVSKHNESPG